MKRFFLLILVLSSFHSFSQKKSSKRERFPSYFGIQVRPILPTRYIGEPISVLNSQEFSTTITQKVGYSFGGTVRAGLTRLLAFESGINFTQRQFGVDMSVADSNVFATNDLTFICYDIPINGLVYVQLSERFYMNASLGAALTFKPTDIGTVTLPGGAFTFFHTGFAEKKGGIDLNANFGFEFRTENKGFFYLGGSARVPFSPLFEMIAIYKYEGYKKTIKGNIDGSFLSVDFKYFFPNINNKGNQFQNGPIE